MRRLIRNLRLGRVPDRLFMRLTSSTEVGPAPRAPTLDVHPLRRRDDFARVHFGPLAARIYLPRPDVCKVLIDRAKGGVLHLHYEIRGPRPGTRDDGDRLLRWDDLHPGSLPETMATLLAELALADHLARFYLHRLPEDLAPSDPVEAGQLAGELFALLEGLYDA